MVHTSIRRKMHTSDIHTSVSRTCRCAWPGEHLPVVIVAAVDGAVADEACQLWVERTLAVLAGQAADMPRDPQCRQVVAVDDYPLTRGTHWSRTGRPTDWRPLSVVLDRVNGDALATFVGRGRWAVDWRWISRHVAGCWRKVSWTRLCRHITAWQLLQQYSTNNISLWI